MNSIDRIMNLGLVGISKDDIVDALNAVEIVKRYSMITSIEEFKLTKAIDGYADDDFEFFASNALKLKKLIVALTRCMSKDHLELSDEFIAVVDLNLYDVFIWFNRNLSKLVSCDSSLKPRFEEYLKQKKLIDVAGKSILDYTAENITDLFKIDRSKGSAFASFDSLMKSANETLLTTTSV